MLIGNTVASDRTEGEAEIVRWQRARSLGRFVPHQILAVFSSSLHYNLVHVEENLEMCAARMS